jgi:hypothetical protein
MNAIPQDLQLPLVVMVSEFACLPHWELIHSHCSPFNSHLLSLSFVVAIKIFLGWIAWIFHSDRSVQSICKEG